MNVYQLIRELNAIPNKMVIASQSALNAEIPRLIVDFQRRSPVDTGAYKQGWYKTNTRFHVPGIMASEGIRNDDPKAQLMEFGAEPKSAPWYYPNKKKPSGKLKKFGGKIWAGGLSPGHSLTKGGAIDPVLYKNNKRQLLIAKLVVDKVMKAI